MNHKISEFCDKVDSLKKIADNLRVLKYKTPKSDERDMKVQNLIDTIQADCLLLAHDKGDYVKTELVSMVIILVLFTTQCTTKTINNEKKKYNPIFSIIRAIVGVPDQLQLR
jgi:hypothetical protein